MIEQGGLMDAPIDYEKVFPETTRRGITFLRGSV